MAKRARLDTELLRRGLVASRGEAQRAIEEGDVTVGGIAVTRSSALVSGDAPIAMRTRDEHFVSRGGAKLDGALRRISIRVQGRRWLDAGASTGGFTDRLLNGGAASVVAVDVGYGQLDWTLRNDARVVVLERTNVRHLTPEDLPWPPEGVTADLSFISLTAVLPALSSVATDDADFLLLVKPQFEVGRKAVGKGGVVRDPALWIHALERVVATAERLGLGLESAVPAYPPGPAGNREFFTHFRRGIPSHATAVGDAVAEVNG